MGQDDPLPDDTQPVIRRHEVGLRFREQYGEEAWLRLQELRTSEYDRYLKAMASIESGRAADVATALQAWTPPEEQANVPADQTIAVARGGPPQAPTDRVVEIWQDSVGKGLPDTSLERFQARAAALGLYELTDEELRSASREACASNDSGRLILHEWAIAADRRAAAMKRSSPGATDWRGGVQRAAEQLRANPTTTEQEVAAILRDGIKGSTFSSQVAMGRYIADFRCDQLPIIIEVDGASHLAKEGRDQSRDEWFAARGFTTLRIDADLADFRTEILDAVRQTIEELHNALRASKGNAVARKRGRKFLYACRACSGTPFWASPTPAPTCKVCRELVVRLCHTCRRATAEHGIRCAKCQDAWTVARELGR